MKRNKNRLSSPIIRLMVIFRVVKKRERVLAVVETPLLNAFGNAKCIGKKSSF